jgi:micrococcal nuclease
MKTRYLSTAYILLALALVIFPSTVSAINIRCEGRVLSITDGDTIKVDCGGEAAYKVRLANIDTPERNQPYGENATEELRSLIEYRLVSLDISTKDRYGRYIATVSLEGVDINRAMVANGHAWVFRRYYKGEDYIEAEAVARRRGLGLWATPNPIAPWDWRRQAKRR